MAKKTNGSTSAGSLLAHSWSRQRDIEYALLAWAATLPLDRHRVHVIAWIANSLCDCQYEHSIPVLAQLMWCVLFQLIGGRNFFPCFQTFASRRIYESFFCFLFEGTGVAYSRNKKKINKCKASTISRYYVIPIHIHIFQIKMIYSHTYGCEYATLLLKPHHIPEKC